MATYSTRDSVGSGTQLTFFLTVWTKELLLKMLPVLRYAEFAVVRTDLLTTPGKSITFPKLSLIKGASALTELTDIVVQSLTPNNKEITTSEYGAGVGVSELAITQSFRPVLDDATAVLSASAAWALNYGIMTPVTNTPNVIFADSKANSGAFDADSFMTCKEVKDAAEFLAGKNAPKFVSPTPVAGVTDYYVGFATPHQLRKLRDDSAWISAAHYGAPGQVFAGEVGMYEKVRFIETTMQPIITHGTTPFVRTVDGVSAGTKATGNATYDVHEAVVFGANAVGWAVGRELELRTNGVKDFNRKQELAWVSVWGFDRIDDDYSVRIESI